MKTDPVSLFFKEGEGRIAFFPHDQTLSQLSPEWMIESIAMKYPYHLKSLGRLMTQYLEDVVVVQELIFKVKLDLIIETRIAHGGSAVQSVSQLALLFLTPSSRILSTHFFLVDLGKKEIII